MEQVEPTPEAPDEVSASSTDLLSVEEATLRGWGRKALRYSAVGAFGALVALGVNNDRGVDTEAGPVNATVHLTFDKKSSVAVESLPAGVKFENKTGIPMVGAGITLNRTSSTQNGKEESSGEIIKNLGILDDPKAVASKVISDYEHQAAKAALIGFAGGAATAAFLEYGFSSRERRKRNIALAGIATIALSASGYWGYQPTKHYDGNTWNQFEAQIGQNTYLKLQYNGVLGNWAADQYAKNEKTYDTIQQNEIKALEPVAKEDKALRPNEKKINVYSDWHCNIGMARGIGTINKTMGINATINAGDNAVGGTSQESICADILSYNLKDTSKTNYLIPGNHDFNFLINEFEQDGVKVINGTMVTINGVKVMGFGDPTTSPAFVDTIHSRDHPGLDEAQTNALVEKFKQDAADKTCKENPAILIMHEPQQTTDAMMNCATLTINGHTHVVELPQQISPDHTLINDGTIGGAASDSETIVNSLGKEATSYIVYVADGQPVGLRLITIKKNGSIEVSEYMSVPHPTKDKAPVANDTLPTMRRHLPGYATSDLFKLAA